MAFLRDLRVRDWRLPTALAVIYVVWGSTYLAIRVMVRSIPPLFGAGARFLLAGLALGLVVILARRNEVRSVSLRQLVNAGISGLFILVGGIGLVTVAEQYVPSALAALVIASIPLWVVLLRLVHRESVQRPTLIGILLGFAGLLVLLRPVEGARPDWLATALLLLASALTAIGAFYSKRVPMPGDPFVATVVQMVVAGAVLLVAGGILGEFEGLSLGTVSSDSWLAFAYLVTVGSVVAYSAFVWLLDNASVSTVSTYAYVNPVVAVALGVLILDEQVSMTMAIGAAVIVLSVFLVVRSEG